jgi:predicted CoA-binding protein
MQTINEAASAFLANGRVAVTGVSRHAENHGSNAIYRRLRERGYEVFAINPNASQVEGDRSYPDLKSIPGGIQAVVIATRPEFAIDTVPSASSSASSMSGCTGGPAPAASRQPRLSTAGSTASP